MSPAASKRSDTEPEQSDEDELRDKTRGEIEVLLLVSGLIMTPQFYLWQTAITNIQSIAIPIWENYLQTQLGSPPYTFSQIMGTYLTPAGLLGALPVDIVLWLYDISIIVNITALVVFGFALMAIESGDVIQVRALVRKGRTCLSIVLLLLIFFTVAHLLYNTMLPFKSLLGSIQVWATLGIALLTAVALTRFLNAYMKKIGAVPSESSIKLEGHSSQES